MILVLKNEATAARRRVYFQCVDVTDGMTPEVGEAGGQPQNSVDGAAFADAGIGVLVSMGNGRYYAELTQALVNVDDAVINTRYKSAATAESVGSTVQVVKQLADILADVTGLNGAAMRGTDNAALAATALSDAVWTAAKAAFLDAAITSRNATVPDAAGTAAGLHAATDALIAGLNDPTAAAIAAAVWALAGAIDGSTPAQALQIIAAAVAGACSGVGVGAAPWTETFLGLDGATPRVQAIIDATFNRTAVAYL